MIRDKWGIVLKFPDRTCKDCKRYPCMLNMEKVIRSDCAKYGCKDYKQS